MNHKADTRRSFRGIRIIAVAAAVLVSFHSSRSLAADTSASSSPADAVVAADGSGKYTNVQDAINAAPQLAQAGAHWTILVKPGRYHELVYVQREKRFISLIGEAADKTVITYDLRASQLGSDGKPIGTFRTPTVHIDADDFTVENLTFENSAGRVGQALALRADGDRIIFRHCRFLGFQDTILLNRGRQYFDHCYIAGATDFIFGGATAYFDSCEIHCVADGYLTAASTPDSQPFGFVFSHTKITGEKPEIRTYLGRPWRPYASTIFLYTEMSDNIRPEGWNNWKKPDAEKTSRYSEFGSTGPGAKPDARVSWTKPLTEPEAQALTIQKVLGGNDGWNPAAAN
jgi:pectinesterase